MTAVVNHSSSVSSRDMAKSNPEEVSSELGRMSCVNRRICPISFATENCKNTLQHIDGHCNPCHKLVPRKLKAEFCIGVGGMVCGRKIEQVNQCYK